MIRSTDAQTYEDGYQWLRGRENEYIDQLIELMIGEKDPLVRERLVEIIGSASDLKIIRVLEAELKSTFPGVRNWAYSSLCYFENENANSIAMKFKFENPHEEFL